MRECCICRKKITAGMVIDNGFLYACEGKCFEKYMDMVYGKNKWMAVEDDRREGYYVTLNDDGSIEDGTGIYYTEWDEGD